MRTLGTYGAQFMWPEICVDRNFPSWWRQVWHPSTRIGWIQNTVGCDEYDGAWNRQAQHMMRHFGRNAMITTSSIRHLSMFFLTALSLTAILDLEKSHSNKLYYILAPKYQQFPLYLLPVSMHSSTIFDSTSHLICLYQ